MRHEWTLRNELQEQLKLFWAEFLHQLFGYPLSPRKRHILQERAKMTRKLWLYVMYRDQWKCQIRSPVCTGRAQEVDHIKALYNWGYTEEDNLQAACHACNKLKGAS